MVKRNDTVICYNHAIEYSLALLILRIRGIKCHQDIEDFPIKGDGGIRGYVSQIGFNLTARLTSSRKIVVSKQLGKSLALQDFFVINGIILKSAKSVQNNKWEELRTGAPLKIHFGGSLMKSTGVDVFCQSLRLLADRQEQLSRSLQFIITGVGEFEKIEAAAKILKGKIQLEMHVAVDRRQYFQLLESCHTSLSLRSPSSKISTTTFPSKVIETASRGLALVTTVVSDIPEIFNDSSAYMLHDFNPEALACTIEQMAGDPESIIKKAWLGKKIAEDLFSGDAIGTELAKFLSADIEEPKT